MLCVRYLVASAAPEWLGPVAAGYLSEEEEDGEEEGGTSVEEERHEAEDDDEGVLPPQRTAICMKLMRGGQLVCLTYHPLDLLSKHDRSPSRPQRPCSQALHSRQSDPCYSGTHVLSISMFLFVSALVATKEGLKEPLIYCFPPYFTGH